MAETTSIATSSVTSTLTATLSPTVAARPSVTIFMTSEALGIRLFIMTFVAIIGFVTFTLGSKILKELTKKRSFFWFSLFFTWVLLIWFSLVLWAMNYHLLIELKASGFLDPLYKFYFICFYSLNYATYGLISTIRIYRTSVTYNLTGKWKNLMNGILIIHILIALIILILQIYAPVELVFNGNLAAAPISSTSASVGNFYYRIICLACDLLFVHGLYKYSIVLRKKQASQSSYDKMTGIINAVFYTTCPTITNIVWYILYYNPRYAILGIYVGCVTVHIEMIAFFKYSNRVMDEAFGRETSGNSLEKHSIGKHVSEKHSNPASVIKVKEIHSQF